MLEKLKNKTYTYNTKNRVKRTNSDRNIEVGSPEWNRMVAEAAYYIAEKRGFMPGYEQDDWFRAENQVREMLRSNRE